MTPSASHRAQPASSTDGSGARAGDRTPQVVSPESKNNGKTTQLIIFGVLLLFSVWMFVRRLSHGVSASTTAIYHGKYGAVVHILDLFPILWMLLIALFLWAFIAAAMGKLSLVGEQPPSQGPVPDASGKQPRSTPDFSSTAAGGRSKLPRWLIALLVVPLLLVVLGLSLDAYNTFGGSHGAPRPLATRLRSFQQGDSWDYRVNGTASLPGGKTGTIRDGTLKVAITGLEVADFHNLTETNDIDMTLSMDGKTLPFSHSQQETFSQNLSGNTYLMSDNGGPQDSIRHVRQPQVETPGVWSAALIQSSHLDFDDGESHDETTTVQGSEVVDTVLGRLTVWRCTQDEADADGTRSKTTLWFAPQLGMPVRTSGTITNPDGMVLTLTTELTKTSVLL